MGDAVKDARQYQFCGDKLPDRQLSSEDKVAAERQQGRGSEGIDQEIKSDTVVSSITSFTVMVSPEQAEVLAYAIMNGTIQCALRNPVDNIKAELQMFGDDNFSTWRDR